MTQKDTIAKAVIKVLEKQKFPQGLTPQDALHQVYLIVEALTYPILKDDEFRQHAGGGGPHYPLYLLLQFAMESRASEARSAAASDDAG